MGIIEMVFVVIIRNKSNPKNTSSKFFGITPFLESKGLQGAGQSPAYTKNHTIKIRGF